MIIDQLSKDIIIKPLKDAIIEMMVWIFIKNVLVLYKPLYIITLDRKPQFISNF